MQTCLVTGVAGFIGSHLAEGLLREGHRVVGIDSFTDYYPRAVKERNLASLLAQPCFFFREADLLDLDLMALLRDPGIEGGSSVSWIFHSAAQPGVRKSWGTFFEVYTRDNVLATQRLLEACREQPVERFIYASSSSIYGDAQQMPTLEDATPLPISPYGVTKLAGEHLCRLYWRSAGVPVVSLRYFTVYGPRQRPDMAFHRFIRAMLLGQEILIYGDGEQTRDFSFVSDVVEANLLAAQRGQGGQVYNIGGGSRVSVNQVLRLLEQITERPARIRYLPPQAGDVRHTAADTSRARDWLGWTPAHDLSEGLAIQAIWQQDLL